MDVLCKGCTSSCRQVAPQTVAIHSLQLAREFLHLGLHPVHGDQLEEHQPNNVEGQVDLGSRVVPEVVWPGDLLYESVSMRVGVRPM